MPDELESRGAAASVGPKIRELRLARGQSQAELARRLGISPAYLNLLEKGRRAVQLPLLWKALELLEVEPEPFIAQLGDQSVEKSLGQLLDDPLARSLNLDHHDLAILSAEPRAVTTITTLFNLYRNARGQVDRLQQHYSRLEATRKERESRELDGEATRSGPQFDYTPLDEVADFLQERRNYFPTVEEASLKLRVDASRRRGITSDDLGQILQRRFGVDIRELPPMEGSVVRRFDAREGTLEISRELGEARRKFDLAHVAGLVSLEDGQLESIIGTFEARHPETRKLIKLHLANYFAGAMLMPYEAFFGEAQRTRYDVERLAGLFETSFEAAAHRITNLGDPRRQGVPFHFLRVDVGGNISKRYSATGLKFPSVLGSCPKWVVHTAFMTPSQLSKQFSVLPDGAAYFCFARVTATPVAGSLVKGTVYSIGMGTHAEDAHHLTYADDHPRWSPQRTTKIGVPVGITCRFCERADCSQRAAPSYRFAFSPDEHVKKDNFFSPVLERDVRWSTREATPAVAFGDEPDGDVPSE